MESSNKQKVLKCESNKKTKQSLLFMPYIITIITTAYRGPVVITQ